MQQPEKQALDRKQPWVGQPRGNEDDEINLVELLYRLIEKWKIIVLACLFGALIAAALLGSAGVALCRDDEDEVPDSQRLS